MTQSYLTPGSVAIMEQVIKKSRFIGILMPADSREAALACVTKVAEDYPGANHYCWAMVAGNPYSPSSVAASDDGEPGNTAGRPILNVLNHRQLGDCVLIVVRYFGGIRLGAGGLVRAYSSTAQMVVDSARLVQNVAKTRCTLHLGFADEHDLRHWLSQHNGCVCTVKYLDHVETNIELPLAYWAELEEFVAIRKWRLVSEK